VTVRVPEVFVNNRVGTKVSSYTCSIYRLCKSVSSKRDGTVLVTNTIVLCVDMTQWTPYEGATRVQRNSSWVKRTRGVGLGGSAKSGLRELAATPANR
jgi:hypothetical protein